MKNFTSLHQILVHQLKVLNDAEKKLQKAMPGFIEKATSIRLKGELRTYHKESVKKIHKVERTLQRVNEKISGKTNRSFDQLLQETNEMLTYTSNEEVRDAVLIGCIQNINHYKIAMYGTANSFAEELREHSVSDILKETLELEKETDLSLTQIALSEVNERAYNVRTATTLAPM